MKKKNLINRSLIMAGLLSLAMTGCGKAPVEPVMQVMAAEEKVMTKEVNKTQKEVPIQKEAPQQTETLGQSETETKGKPTSLANDTVEDPELVQVTADVLKKYFDVVYDSAEYEGRVTYFAGYEDIDPNYLVLIEPKGNWNMNIIAKEESFAADGWYTEEALKQMKPEYSATFSDKKELTGLYVSFMGWEKAEKLLGMDEIKKVAKDFLTDNQLTVDGKAEFVSSSIISRQRTMVSYKNGADGAILVAVDPTTGKVEHFQYMSKERAELIMRPKTEAECVG